MLACAVVWNGRKICAANAHFKMSLLSFLLAETPRQLKTLHLSTHQATLSKDNRPWRALYLPYSIHTVPRDPIIRHLLCKKHWLRAAKHHVNKRKKYDFAVVANLTIPKLPVTVEPADGKENRITFAYTVETSTRAFANNVQEWKEYWLTVNAEEASATLPDSAKYATGMNVMFT